MVSNNKRIVKNSIFLLSRTIFLTLVTLYTLREVISILGLEQFGLYTVVFGVVAMFAFVNNAMMSATQRFLSISIGIGIKENITCTFFYSLFIHIILAIIVGIFIFFLRDIFLNQILDVNGYKVEAEKIYYLALLTIVISFIQVPFSALITAYEKMQAFAYLAILEGILKLVVVYALTLFSYNKAVLYALFLTIISFLIFLLHIVYCYFNFNRVFRFFYFEFLEAKRTIFQMLTFIGWSLIGNLSIVLRNHGSTILLNVFFGLVANAAFAISLTVMTAIGALVSSVSNAIKPQIFKAYAEGNLKKYYMLISNGTKYYIYFLSLIIVPIIFYMEYIMDFWLVNYPDGTVLFCQLILIMVFIDSFSILLTVGIQADGRIKWNQIITGTLLCLPLPITYFLYQNGYSENSIFYMFIIVSILSLFTKLYFIKKLTGYGFLIYLSKVLYPCCIVIFINLLVIFGIIYIFGMPTNLVSFMLSLICFIFLSILLILIFGLGSLEKSRLKKYFLRN